MSRWEDEYLTMIDDCEDRSDRITEWEGQFLDSLRRQIGNGRRPTEKQIEILDRVWEKATIRG